MPACPAAFIASASNSRNPLLHYPAKLPPLLFGGPTEAFRVLRGGLEVLCAGASVLFGGSQIFEKLDNPGRADALFEQREHFDRAMNAAREGGDYFADSKVARGFHPLPANLDVARLASVYRQRATFVEADGPKPLVNANGFHGVI